LADAALVKRTMTLRGEYEPSLFQGLPCGRLLRRCAEAPDWYFHLLANLHIDVRDGATTVSMVAPEVSGIHKADRWNVADAVWPHFLEYRTNTDRDLLI
jgi:hypothetical protein